MNRGKSGRYHDWYTPSLTISPRLREQSRQWFNEYESLRAVLQPVGSEASSEAYRETKIAVLDTGLRQEDYEYLAEFGPVQYNDFVSPASPPCDDTGHGSTSVSLLIRMCPNARLYVARVLENNVATLRHVATIVEVSKPIRVEQSFSVCKPLTFVM